MGGIDEEDRLPALSVQNGENKYMKKTLVLFAIFCAPLCAADKATNKGTAPAPRQSGQSIPKGAKEIEPYLYSYQDAGGKKWLYRQTPFGIVKMEDKPQPAPVVVQETNPIVATDLGETVSFQKQTPFGTQTWTKKKSELSEEEKVLLPRTGAEQAGKKTAENR